MRGFAFHQNLAGATFLGEFNTAPVYRLYSIDDIHPGMFEVERGGVSVAGEYYELSTDIWTRVEAGEPPNLYCGPVKLEDGHTVSGVLFPRKIAEVQYKDISEYGGWRNYIASLSS